MMTETEVAVALSLKSSDEPLEGRLAVGLEDAELLKRHFAYAHKFFGNGADFLKRRKGFAL